MPSSAFLAPPLEVGDRVSPTHGLPKNRWFGRIVRLLPGDRYRIRLEDSGKVITYMGCRLSYEPTPDEVEARVQAIRDSHGGQPRTMTTREHSRNCYGFDGPAIRTYGVGCRRVNRKAASHD